MQRLSAHVRSVLGGEEDVRRADLAGLPRTAHRDVLSELRNRLGVVVADRRGDQRCPDRPGSDLVDADPSGASCWDNERVKATIAPFVVE